MMIKSIFKTILAFYSAIFFCYSANAQSAYKNKKLSFFDVIYYGHIRQKQDLQQLKEIPEGRPVYMRRQDPSLFNSPDGFNFLITQNFGINTAKYGHHFFSVPKWIKWFLPRYPDMIPETIDTHPFHISAFACNSPCKTYRIGLVSYR